MTNRNYINVRNTAASCAAILSLGATLIANGPQAAEQRSQRNEPSQDMETFRGCIEGTMAEARDSRQTNAVGQSSHFVLVVENQGHEKEAEAGGRAASPSGRSPQGEMTSGKRYALRPAPNANVSLAEYAGHRVMITGYLEDDAMTSHETSARSTDATRQRSEDHDRSTEQNRPQAGETRDHASSTDDQTPSSLMVQSIESLATSCRPSSSSSR